MEASDDGRYDLLLKAHEAQTRHLAAERLRVAEQLDDLRAALERERERGDRAEAELDFLREKRNALEEERDSYRVHFEESQALRENLQERYDSALQSRALRWSAKLRRLLRRG